MIREYSIGRFLINKNGTGLTLDTIRGKAIIEGFLLEEASINDLIELLKSDLRGNKAYSIFKQITEEEMAVKYKEGFRRQYGDL